MTPGTRSIIPNFLIALCLLAALAIAACGDYRPCEVLAYRICEDCPKVHETWKAACMCIENGSLKENGYKCQEVTEQDKINCNATLENWDESVCELLN